MMEKESVSDIPPSLRPRKSSFTEPDAETKKNHSEEVKLNWIRTTCFPTIRAIFSLFTQQFEYTNFLLPNFMDLLSSFMNSEHSLLPKIGSRVLDEFLINISKQLTEEMWFSILNIFVNVIANTRPKLLYYTKKGNKSNVKNSTRQGELHLLILDQAKQIIFTFYDSLVISQMQVVYEEIHQSAVVAREFHQQTNNPYPNSLFIQIEQRANLRCVEILEKLYTDERNEYHDLGNTLIIPTMTKVMEDHLINERTKELYLDVVVCLCVDILLKLPHQYFFLHFSELFPFLCQLICSENLHIRQRLSRLFLTRIPGNITLEHLENSI